MQLAAAAALLPIATLCCIVTFYTCKVNIERVMLCIDGMACCALYMGAKKKDRPRYNCCLLAVLVV